MAHSEVLVGMGREAFDRCGVVGDLYCDPGIPTFERGSAILYLCVMSEIDKAVSFTFSYYFYFFLAVACTISYASYCKYYLATDGLSARLISGCKGFTAHVASTRCTCSDPRISLHRRQVGLGACPGTSPASSGRDEAAV